MLTDLAAGRGPRVRETPQTEHTVSEMHGHQHGTVKHPLSEQVLHLVCKNAKSAVSSHHHQLSWLWPPSHLLQVKGHFKSYFSTRFSDQGLWVLLNALTVAGYVPQGLNLTFEPQFSRSFYLPSTKGLMEHTSKLLGEASEVSRLPTATSTSRAIQSHVFLSYLAVKTTFDLMWL